MFRYDRMNELAQQTGVKKAHLCRLLGKSPYYLRDAEKNDTNITGESLDILAKALNTTPEYLAGITDEKEPPVDDDEELWEIRQAMKDRDELKTLFHMGKNASPERVKKMLKILQLMEEEETVDD